MQTMVSKHLDFKALRKSQTKIVISTVNVHTARPHYFDNHEILLEHVLASSAMPILFPWHEINGIPHWDGGIMANIPLQPALDFGVDEIIIALLSPVGHTPQALPKNVLRAGEHILEQFLAAPYQSMLKAKGYQDLPLPLIPDRGIKNDLLPDFPGKQPSIITLAPSKMLGFRSLIKFSLPEARRLIKEGYETAKKQLKPLV